MATRKKSTGKGSSARKSSGGRKRSGGRKTGKKTGGKKTGAGSTGKKSGARKANAGKSSGKRELISPRGNKRFVRRGSGGEFTESDDQSRSLSQDVKKKAKTKVKSGQGDRGDQQR